MFFRTCLSLLILIGLLAACNFTEEIYVNADGSGKLSINFDGNEFLSMMGAMDSLPQEEAMHSSIVFKQLLEEKKDSIATL